MVRTVRWDEKKGKFELMYQEKRDPQRIKKRDIFSQLLWETFMPSGELTPDYYKYTLWRLAQRFVGATSSVFGTQALVLALGFKSHSLGIAAATRWVLKDALGKVSRIFWASRHGRKFDFNAKKWRFRSALLFAAGNGFEILTYVFPAFFLILAAVANASKQVCAFSLPSFLFSLSPSPTHIAAPLFPPQSQMAMLTSSATRNAIYKSFSRKSDNIGDITAKGEAQIAVVDLLGMVVGIYLARFIAGDRYRMVAAFAVMSALDIFCIHKEIRSVIFNSLNYERTGLVLDSIFSGGGGGGGAAITPNEVAEREELMMPYLISERTFATWISLSPLVAPKHLETAFSLFAEEKFCIVLHLEAPPRGGKRPRLVPQVLLRKEACAVDIFRALVVVHRALFDFSSSTASRPPSLSSSAQGVLGATGSAEEDKKDESGAGEGEGPAAVLLLDFLLREAQAYEKRENAVLLASMAKAGWDTTKFTYGAVSDRVQW
jgi:hypothetical protein